MCACMPVCFQRNLVTFAKARPAQMIFITTSYYLWFRRAWGQSSIFDPLALVDDADGLFWIRNGVVALEQSY